MPNKEAQARIRINRLLENAGWRFFADANGPANIQLEPSVTLTKQALDDLGENFEKATKGFIDFLLLNEKGFPFIVLEAKSEDKNPLVGKEQARKYARSQNCRFVILSNGNLHYFWDLERGNPYVITTFPTPASITGYQKSTPDPKRLIEEVVADDYVVLTQRPGYASEAAWKSEAERTRFIETNSLRFLRPYQKKAVYAIQQAVAKGNDRFLLEMATGTGKTLTSAAIIKLFLRTGNARRVLFLVDRLELEDQALKAFKKVLANDYKSVIYKENRDDWRHAEVVVSTVQSLLFNNKYQQLFSPTDFDLVISDEAHRSIGGNARAVFDYFIGYKLGLTATPRDYLKKFDKNKPTTKDPREFERRLLLDTYRTFGCGDGHPPRLNESSVMRFLKLIGCDNGKVGSYAALVKERNDTAHTNGNIFFSTQAALDTKIREILRVVDEIQTHSTPTIQRCYSRFLIESNNPDDREYADDADQIREVLIHGNYLSQKDIEICAAFDWQAHEKLEMHTNAPGIKSLHQTLRATYVEPDAATTA